MNGVIHRSVNGTQAKHKGHRQQYKKVVYCVGSVEIQVENVNRLVYCLITYENMYEYVYAKILISASVAYLSERLPPTSDVKSSNHVFGHLITRGNRWSTLCRKPWVFLRVLRYPSTGKLTVWVRINS